MCPLKAETSENYLGTLVVESTGGGLAFSEPKTHMPAPNPRKRSMALMTQMTIWERMNPLRIGLTAGLGLSIKISFGWGAV